MSDSPSLIDRLRRPLVNNEVSTREEGLYPEITPREYETDPETVFRAARQAIEARKRWTIVEADTDKHRLEVEVTTKLAKFVDDLIVEVESDNDGGAVVHAESSSRVGEGDFGQNAKTVRELFERIDSELGLE